MLNLIKVLIALIVSATAVPSFAVLEWDETVPVPMQPTGEPDKFWVCQEGARFREINATGEWVCVPGGYGAKYVQPRLMTLQAALDSHYAAPAGFRAEAIGPIRIVRESGSVNPRVMQIALRLKKR